MIKWRIPIQIEKYLMWNCGWVVLKVLLVHWIQPCECGIKVIFMEDVALELTFAESVKVSEIKHAV